MNSMHGRGLRKLLDKNNKSSLGAIRIFYGMTINFNAAPPSRTNISHLCSLPRESELAKQTFPLLYIIESFIDV